jgi:hypothetical protein
LTVVSITLHDPDTGLTSQVWPRLGVAYQGYQVQGTPRAVTESRTGGDGTVDATRNLDDAAISLNLRLYATPQALMDEFAAFLHPRRRPLLIVEDTEWAQPRQLLLRSDTHTTPREVGTGITRNVQFQWRGPNGMWEQTGDLLEFAVPVTLPATDGLHVQASGGLHFPSTGLDVKPTGAVGEYEAVNPGSEDVPWQGFLYGPCVGPKIANDSVFNADGSQGQALEFTDDVVLQAGDYLWLDSTGQALINSDPDSSVLTSLDTGTSDWWPIQPGTNLLRYYPTTGSAGAVALIYCRPGWYPQ